MKLIAKNKRAFHEYDIDETYEAGIVLTGDEVKSIRKGGLSLGDSYAVVKKGEIYLLNCHIASYSHAFSKEDDSRRSRKLLLKKREISKLIGDVSRKGATLVPLKIYFNPRGFIKLEIATAKHKKAAGKKQALKEKDIRRETEREMKNYNR
jgi:SsrA-binding protein